MATKTQSLADALSHGAKRLRDGELPAEVARRFDDLAEQVHQPCVVAVVGRMKAGKSTFINALLGEDLAKVGATETTATINYFRHGTPDPEKPVHCHWRSGFVTKEDKGFLDSLQGADVETLRRAQGIHHLEYHLLNTYLQEATLVDTPGTSAVVDEHQDRTAQFLALRKQLSDRHDQETRLLGSEADAVIYLVGQVTRSTDRAFLEEFAQTTGGKSRALNAIGVLAKIDIQPEILASRHRLADKISGQLSAELNTVLPVSAGLRRELDRLCAIGNETAFAHFVKTLRRIPPAQIEKLLDNEDFYRELDPPDCPVSPAERVGLLGGMPWGVFTTMARLAADQAHDLADVRSRIEDLSGFERLKEVLDQRFFKRGRFLRAFRIVNEALAVLDEIRYVSIPQCRDKDAENARKLERFLAVIRESPADPSAAKELEEFLTTRMTVGQVDKVSRILADLDRDFVKLYHELSEIHADLDALRQMDDQPEDLSDAEQDELKTLFGQYGLETERRLPAGRVDVGYVEARQQFWLPHSHSARSAGRRMIAERAVSRYGIILAELGSGGNGGESTA